MRSVLNVILYIPEKKNWLIPKDGLSVLERNIRTLQNLSLTRMVWCSPSDWMSLYSRYGLDVEGNLDESGFLIPGFLYVK